MRAKRRGSRSLETRGRRGRRGSSRTGAEATAGADPRERQIVAMIARGLMQQGLAEELVSSPGHSGPAVANILLKLGFSRERRSPRGQPARTATARPPRV